MDDIENDIENIEVITPKQAFHYPGEYVGEDGKNYLERDGEVLRVMRNGTLLGKEGFKKGSKIDSSIRTTEQAREMANKSKEKKRRVMMEAANEAVENRTYNIQYGDMAYVAAIANSAMIKATTPEDPKAIEAARFVLKQTGLLEEEEEDKKEKNASVLEALGREAVMQVLERARQMRES